MLYVVCSVQYVVCGMEYCGMEYGVLWYDVTCWYGVGVALHSIVGGILALWVWAGRSKNYGM